MACALETLVIPKSLFLRYLIFYEIKNILGGGFYMQHKGLWILKGIVSNTKQDTDSRAKNPTCSNDNNYALFTDVSQYLGEFKEPLLVSQSLMQSL